MEISGMIGAAAGVTTTGTTVGTTISGAGTIYFLHYKLSPHGCKRHPSESFKSLGVVVQPGAKAGQVVVGQVFLQVIIPQGFKRQP